MMTTEQHVNGAVELVAAATPPRTPPVSAPDTLTSATHKGRRARAFLAAASLLFSVVDGEAAPLPGPSVVTASLVTASVGDEAPVADFEVIWDDQLSTSRTPGHDHQWLWVRARGVNSIVNLDDRALEVAPFGFGSFLAVRLGKTRVPTADDAERFLTFIQLPDNQPVHIASVARNRRAIMVALLRYAIEGWTIEQALAEAQRLDCGAGLTPDQIEWLLAWARSHPPGSHLRAASTLPGTTSMAGPAPSPVADFEVIWDGQLSTSRTPAHDRQWQWVRALGVNSIVNLDGRMLDVAQYGFASFLAVRLSAGGVPTDEDAERFLAFIQLADNQPVHVSSGARHRRATMVALLRYAIEGWTMEQALAEGRRRDCGKGLGHRQIDWLLGWARSHPPGSHRRVASALTTTSMVDSTPSPVADFEVMWNGQLSTSRTPAYATQWRWVRARGVNSIVNLDDQVLDVGQYGFEGFLWVRPGAGGIPTDEDAERFLTFIQLADNQPVHIASVAPGTMVALLRYAIEGWTIEQALAEGQRLEGGAGLTPDQIEWLLGWARSHPPGSHRRSAASAPLGREDTDAPDRVPREPTKVVVSHRRLPSVDSVVSPA
jgi:hypothetical protein